MRRFVAFLLLSLCLLGQTPVLAVTRADVAQEIQEIFGPAAQKALRVGRCESKLVSTATHRNRNGTTDWGVFQLNDGGTLQALGLTTSEALDYQANIRAAYRLYQRRGWAPWVCQ